MCLWLVMCATLQCAWCVTVCDFVNVPQVNPEHNSYVDNYKLFGILSSFMIIERRCNTRGVGVGGGGWLILLLYTYWEILTTKLCRKVSYANSSNQSEERTMVFTREKKRYVQSKSRAMFFHLWEKWYVQSEATEVCEFRPKIPAFYCSLQNTFNEKSFTQSFCR